MLEQVLYRHYNHYPLRVRMHQSGKFPHFWEIYKFQNISDKTNISILQYNSSTVAYL